MLSELIETLDCVMTDNGDIEIDQAILNEFLSPTEDYYKIRNAFRLKDKTGIVLYKDYLEESGT